MSTVEDFENAPVGATATHKVSGSRAMKMSDGDQYWITPWGNYLSDEQMGLCDYTLDPPAPATAREALDLAWELAHEVKEGQVIPKGTRFMEVHSSGVRANLAQYDFEISSGLAPGVRTVEPLPEPEPDWLDAPAVIATTIGNDNHRTFANVGNSRWHAPGEKSYPWTDLTDVTPLYPKEGQDA